MKRRIILSLFLILVTLPITFSSPYVNVSSTPCTESNNSTIEVALNEKVSVNSVTVSLMDDNFLMSNRSQKVVFLYGFDLQGESLNRTLSLFDGSWSCYGTRIESGERLSQPLTYIMRRGKVSYSGIVGDVDNSTKVALFNLSDGSYHGYERQDTSSNSKFYPIYYSSNSPDGEDVGEGFNLSDPKTKLDFFELPKGNYTISVTLTTEAGTHYSEVGNLEVKRDSEDFDSREKLTEEPSQNQDDFNYIVPFLVISLLFAAWLLWRSFRKD